MIDLENYRRAIEWLDRGLTEQAKNAADQTIQESVILSFEVTYNLTESILRRTLSDITEDDEIAFLSSRELMRYAADYGLTLTSAEQWLLYGLALEEATKHQQSFAEVDATLLSRYVSGLRAFCKRLEKRLVALA